MAKSRASFTEQSKAEQPHNDDTTAPHIDVDFEVSRLREAMRELEDFPFLE
jgi:hypothetical protein